ncbi:MAG: hypothetical protein NTX82_00435 [Candidatus Parcubacteria bacterium]|nr:hypothetical protein [Candidatus Parcubacteria bacterium]
MSGKVIGQITPVNPPQMIDGVFYDLNPPSHFLGKTFNRVMCEYRVPSHPDEYSVKGIPEGSTKPEPFIFKFTGRGQTVPRLSEDQEGF